MITRRKSVFNAVFSVRLVRIIFSASLVLKTLIELWIQTISAVVLKEPSKHSCELASNVITLVLIVKRRRYA